MAIPDDKWVAVSRRVREEQKNGKEYYACRGEQLSNLPESLENRLLTAFLNRYQEQV
ncbi:hypothetical protein [Rhodohalobacter sp.]|uniref:hypothetical protein n=1 Tax=Rhodohalobacter sp. TaxID=1974210 RepID=UPI003563EB05